MTDLILDSILDLRVLHRLSASMSSSSYLRQASSSSSLSACLSIWLDILFLCVHCFVSVSHNGLSKASFKGEERWSSDDSLITLTGVQERVCSRDNERSAALHFLFEKRCRFSIDCYAAVASLLRNTCPSFCFLRVCAFNLIIEVREKWRRNTTQGKFHLLSPLQANSTLQFLFYPRI